MFSSAIISLGSLEARVISGWHDAASCAGSTGAGRILSVTHHYSYRSRCELFIEFSAQHWRIRWGALECRGGCGAWCRTLLMVRASVSSVIGVAGHCPHLQWCLWEGPFTRVYGQCVLRKHGSCLKVIVTKHLCRFLWAGAFCNVSVKTVALGVE